MAPQLRAKGTEYALLTPRPQVSLRVMRGLDGRSVLLDALGSAQFVAGVWGISSASATGVPTRDGLTYSVMLELSGGGPVDACVISESSCMTARQAARCCAVRGQRRRRCNGAGFVCLCLDAPTQSGPSATSGQRCA